MKQTKRVAHGPLYPEHWQVSPTYQHGTKLLSPGTELTITGERGAKFRFVEHVVVPPHNRHRKGHEHIAVIGGTRGVTMFRFFRPEEIATVTAPRKVSTAKARQHVAAAREAARQAAQARKPVAS